MASIPWIVAALGIVVLLLLAFRLALFLREWMAERSAVPVEPTRRPPAVKPGSPLAPPPPSAPEPKPAQKPTPLQLRIADAPDLRLASFKGDDQAQGDFGDLLTAASLAAQGWKRLPSKLSGRGIDGLFVREVKGGGGFECLAIETKTNSVEYDPTSMSDAKLAADIAQLYEVGALSKATADELMRALRQGPSFFRKELWRHDLSSGMTTITELGRNGEKSRSITRSNARLVSALFMSLEQLDRRSVYVGGDPIDDEV